MKNNLKYLTNVKVKGVENYPKDAPSVIISNHNRLMDIFYVPMVLDDYVVSLISSRLVYKKEIDRIKVINEHLNPFPIEAHGGSVYANLCLKYATKILQSGVSVNIFPEGAYLPEKDVVYRGRTGAARILFDCLLKDKTAYFLPVAIDIDSKEDLDNYNFNVLDNINVKILNPIDIEDYYYKYTHANNHEEKNTILHELTDTGMQVIATSLNRKYFNEYIELRPKGNVIFESGNVVDTNLAQTKDYIEKYEKELSVRTLSLIPKIR